MISNNGVLVIEKVIRKKSKGWKPICVEADVYEVISQISAETGKSIGSIATMILNFGLERVVIEEEDDEETL